MALTKITGQVVNTSTDLTVGVLTATTVSVGGTLTYEDVTNVDSVGIITARSDISIADKIVHTEDTDTAIRFPDANTFTVETGGSERLRITSSGRIGIGTTNPAAELEVIDDSSLGVISRSGSTQATDANKALRVRNNSTTDTFSVSYKGQGYFAGKMGLGTASPTETLTLNSVSGASIGFEHNGTEIATISNNNAALYVHAGSGNLLSLGANGSEAARIDTSGRLLLGTTTAGNGAADDLTLATTGNTGITVRSGASSQGAVYFSDGTSGADEYRGIILYDHSNNAMSLYSDGSERMMIDSSGRLLVGHSSNIQNQSLQVVTSNGGAAGLYKYGNNDDGSELTFFTSRNDSKGSHTVVQNGDYLGRIFFRGSDGSGFDRGAEIAVKVDGTPGTNDMPGRLEFYTTPDGSTTPTERLRIKSNGNVGINDTAPSEKLNVGGNIMLEGGDQYMYLTNAGTGNAGIYVRGNTSGAYLRSHSTGLFTWEVVGSEKMRLDSAGRLLLGKTASGVATRGAELRTGNNTYALTGTADAHTVMLINRNTDDGQLIQFRQGNTQEGTISVSGNTVTYGGGHLARWSQLSGGADRIEILRGSILSNLDEMCEWGDEDNEQLNRMKVSDVEGDPRVAGVFEGWDNDDDTYRNDFYCAMTGDFVIRIAQGTTVANGDLLMSAGDGTAKPQDDDIIRSKTIAKVTSTTVSVTYSDGSYCVPCVLMSC